jgi:hypothetical protein
MALYYFKLSGEFDTAICEWENKPTADKTWKNIKMFISVEYVKENKQDKLTAKQFKANMIEEQAVVTEELIANINEAHTHHMEALIKSMTDAMKEMMQIIKDGKNPTTNDEKANMDKQKKCEERQKKLDDAPVCKHCRKKHPSKKEDKCWELEANKFSHLSNWKSTKST